MIDAASRGTAVRLFLLGFLTLFLELALIRYLAGAIWNLGYFPNLVLLAVFVGMGVGFVFHGALRQAWSPGVFVSSAFALAGLITVIYFARPAVPGFANTGGVIGEELYFTLIPAGAGQTWGEYALFGLWFGAIVVIFAAISQRTAKVFRTLKPLRAYTLDIGGSIAGILAFMAVSFLRLPAWSWFVLVAVLYLLLTRPKRWVVAAVPLVGIVALVQRQDTRLTADPRCHDLQVAWSPYQKVEYVPNAGMIFVNGIPHQAMVGFDAESAYAIPHRRRQEEGRGRYRNVLVIGAGSGNDVTAALAYGAEHIDAVEIDPVIADIGRQGNPLQPYSDPRVNLVVDDARAFMSRTTRKYDLVVYALTDSLVRVSSMAQLRLENYLFTEDSFRRAYALLDEDGDMLMYNYYRRPWLIAKLAESVFGATGKYPQRVYQRDDYMMFRVGRGLPSGAPPEEAGRYTPATDDWPFPYLMERGVPALYRAGMAAFGAAVLALLLAVHLAGRRHGGALAGWRGLATKSAFVLMGLAFLLLETKSIVQFSLLFGTTWLNSSLVFLAVLVLVLAANWTATLFRGRALLPAAFALLLGSCVVTLVWPLSNLLRVESGAVRFIVASLMTFSPIFFANLIFSVTFRDQVVPEHLFGWNLLGATLGGLVEYTSLAIGYNALAVIVAAAYALVFVLLALGRRPSAAPTEQVEVRRVKF
jgi:hypothetical protein